MGVKVLTVIGTRPEAIKLFPLIHALEGDPRFESRVCVTGQHREMVDEVLAMAGIAPDHDLQVFHHGQDLDHIAARILDGMGPLLDREAPHWVVVQGDTTSAMTSAVAAYHRRLPVCHVEAGLRTGDLASPWPEEGNRRILTALAAMHCAPTAVAEKALVAEGVPAQTIHVTGNTVIDALRWTRAAIAARPALASRMQELEHRFFGRRIIAVTSHRRENLGGGLASITHALQQIARRTDVAIICPLHPNPQVRTAFEDALANRDNVALVKALDYANFVRLLEIADLIMTDSGGVQEEALDFGCPVLVMRETTERPEGLESGALRLVGADPKRIVSEAEHVLSDFRRRAARPSGNPFGDGCAARRIAALLQAKCRTENLVRIRPFASP